MCIPESLLRGYDPNSAGLVYFHFRLPGDKILLNWKSTTAIYPDVGWDHLPAAWKIKDPDVHYCPGKV